MISEQDALRLVEEYLAPQAQSTEGGLIIYPPKSKPYGWVFRYTSRLWAETGDIQYAYGGGGPIVVESASGALHELGSANHPDIALAEFEKEHGFG